MDAVDENAPVETGEFGTTRYEIIEPNTPTSRVKIYLEQDIFVKAVPGCMIATSPNIEIEGKLKKSFKALVGPDKARYQTFTARDGPGWVLLSPSFFGSIRALPLNDDEVLLGDDAMLASIGDVETAAKSQSTSKAFFSGHGWFVKKVKGTGVVFISAVGAMKTYDLADGEEIVVDTGHLVSWPKEVEYEIKRANKSWTSTGLSGEGFVSRIKGPGRINVQLRSGRDIAEWTYDTKTPP